MKGTRSRSATIFLSLLTAGTLQAAPLRCVIEPDRAAEVGSPVIGVVESINVERGDFVREGQLLAKLRSNVERASVGAAEARAQAGADLRGAKANYEFMLQKQTRAEELVQKNFISQQALDQVRAETSVARQKFIQAQEQQRVASQELELAQAQLRQRLVRAPFDGIVAERYVTVGERVEDKPMFRVAKVNRLRVEIIVPAALVGSIRTGMVAKVTPDIPNSAAIEAKVVLVDTLVDAASNTFRVRAELPNADGSVTSGLRCRAELYDPPPTDPAAALAPEPLAQKLDANLKLESAITNTKLK